MSGIGMDASTEKRDGALWQEEQQLQEAIETVAQRFEILEKRLSPILRERGPAIESPKEPAADNLPDLVERLRARKAAVQTLETKLTSVLERLEI